jgi:hypothetical protein
MRSGIYIIAMMLALVVQSASAGTVAIPGHTPSEQVQVLPVRGVNMDSVLAEFGEPIQRYDAIGEPPISEWVYGGFRVYFEYEIVLHAIDMNTLIMPK